MRSLNRVAAVAWRRGCDCGVAVGISKNVFAYFSAENRRSRERRGRKTLIEVETIATMVPRGLNKELWPTRGGLSHGAIHLAPHPMVVEDRHLVVL